MVKLKYTNLLENEMFTEGIILVNDIINRAGGVVTHAADTDIWKCLLYPKLQIIAALPQKWKRQVEGEKSKERVCLSVLH